MRRCVVLVDAGYLHKAAGRIILNRDCRREELVIDGGSIVSLLDRAAVQISGSLLLRIYWYDGARKGPTPEHLAIAELAHVKLRLGQVNSAGEQKGVDPLIIMDMITLARNHACDEMVLLSGDADLIIGVMQAQEYGVRVHLLGIPPSRANQAPTLRQESDTTSELTIADIQGVFSVGKLSPFTVPTGTMGATPAPLSSSATGTPSGASAPSTPQAGAPTVSAPAAVVTDAQLLSVAEAVDSRLTAPQRASVLAESSGPIPGAIDKQLLGTAKKMLNVLLTDADKRTLRRLLRQASQRPRS